VLGHEIAHALAHHASERIGLKDSESVLESLSYNRFQESEADHIGVFLMTFAGYNPEAALEFWDRMRESSSGSLRLPEFLSDHPADARRLAQLRGWIPLAEGGKAAYDRGEIAPEPSR